MLSDDVIQQVLQDLKTASSARQNGLEGRSRVIARRTAALAISSWMCDHPTQKLSAIDTLVAFQSLDLPDEVHLAVGHLLQKVDENYNLEEGIDLIVDANTILSFCQSNEFQPNGEDTLNDSTPILIVYGTNWCGATRRTLSFLDAHQIPYTYIDIDRDTAARTFVEETNHGFRSVPTILFPDGSTLTEPLQSELAEKLGFDNT